MYLSLSRLKYNGKSWTFHQNLWTWSVTLDFALSRAASRSKLSHIYPSRPPYEWALMRELNWTLTSCVSGVQPWSRLLRYHRYVSKSLPELQGTGLRERILTSIQVSKLSMGARKQKTHLSIHHVVHRRDICCDWLPRVGGKHCGSISTGFLHLKTPLWFWFYRSVKVCERSENVNEISGEARAQNPM